MPALRYLIVGVIAALVLAPAPALAGKPPPGFAATLPLTPAPRVADGAIFNVAAGYAPLVGGARARVVGDALTVVLNEITTSTKTSATKTQRSGSAAITTPTTGPFVINPSALTASSTGSFNGSGNTALASTFNGAVSVTIVEVRNNGTALVRGEKRMLLSQGQNGSSSRVSCGWPMSMPTT